MQRSFYSSGYLSNGNLGRSGLSGQYESPTRSQIRGESSSFYNELENHHDRSVQIANDRLKSQEIQHERNLESLRSQIASLKQQLEHNEKSSSRELARIEEDYAYRLNILSREADIRLRPLVAQINEYEKDIERAGLSCSSEIREITKTTQEINQENEVLRDKIKGISVEIENSKKKLYEDSQKELETLNREKKSSIREHHSDLEKYSDAHRRNVSSLHQMISEREVKIDQLHEDLVKKKNSLNELIYNSNDEISRLEEALQDTRILLSRQEKDVNHIHYSLNEAKKESKILMNEKLSMESEINRTKNENEFIKQEITRLDRLVYGKRSPKKTS